MSGFDDNPFGEPIVDNPFAVSVVVFFADEVSFFFFFFCKVNPQRGSESYSLHTLIRLVLVRRGRLTFSR